MTADPNDPALFIPPMPEDSTEAWQLLWRFCNQLATDLDLVQLELAFYKSQDQRKKWAGTYAEEAVAQVYGLVEQDFYGNRRQGRTRQAESNVSEARFMLYTILHNIIGVPVGDISKNYGTTAYNHVSRWAKIFEIVHTVKALTDEKKKALYDQYAPRYRKAYWTMKEAMLRDGVWHTAYRDILIDKPL